jgi:hypothetical protein
MPSSEMEVIVYDSNISTIEGDKQVNRNKHRLVKKKEK